MIKILLFPLCSLMYLFLFYVIPALFRSKLAKIYTCKTSSSSPGRQICLNLHTGPLASGEMLGAPRDLETIPLSLSLEDWNMNFDDDAIKLILPFVFMNY